MSYEAGRSYEDSSPVERTERQADIPVYQDAQKVRGDTRDATTVVLRSPEEVQKEKQDPSTYIRLLDVLQGKLILSCPDKEESIRRDIEKRKQEVRGFLGDIVPHVQGIFVKKMEQLEKQYGQKDYGAKKKKKKQKQYVEM